MDGLKLTLQQAGNETQQDNFYNGWTHEHYVTNLFLFLLKEIFFVLILMSKPGVIHDLSTMAIWSSIFG